MPESPVQILAGLEARAHSAGLTRVWVVPRAVVEAACQASPVGAEPPSAPVTPARFHPLYGRVVLLASGGRAFWEAFRRAWPRMEEAAPHPLDRFSETAVGALAAHLRQWDPGTVDVFPFHHARQLLGFGRLLGGAAHAPWSAAAPFGLAVDPVFGPWWVWRGALLTALELPPSDMPADASCTGCPAPCVQACPVGAVAMEGFDWEACAAFRLRDPCCEERCLARSACPVGAEHRYGQEQMAYHYAASLRMIRRWAAERER